MGMSLGSKMESEITPFSSTASRLRRGLLQLLQEKGDVLHWANLKNKITALQIHAKLGVWCDSSR
jgi:hypothetical protein